MRWYLILFYFRFHVWREQWEFCEAESNQYNTRSWRNGFVFRWNRWCCGIGERRINSSHMTWRAILVAILKWRTLNNKTNSLFIFYSHLYSLVNEIHFFQWFSLFATSKSLVPGYFGEYLDNILSGSSFCIAISIL